MSAVPKPFIALDVKALVNSIKETRKGFSITAALVREAMGKGMAMVMEELGEDAKAHAPHRDGGLNNRWQTNVEMNDNGNLLIGTCGFNIVYANVRDIGTAHLPGGQIRPVRAKALFIPLRKGARPGDKSLVRGVDFVLSGGVTQKGNRFWTNAKRRAERSASSKFAKALAGLLKYEKR